MTPEQQLRAAQQAVDQGRLPEAEVLFRKLLKKKPNDAAVLDGLGALLLRKGELAEAHELIARAAWGSSPPPSAVRHLGEVLFHLGDVAAAEEAYRRALVLNSSDFEAWSDLANVFCGLGRFDEAIAACERALALQPNYVGGLFNLGVAQLRAGAPEKALPAFDKIIALAPAVAQAHHARGQVLQAMDRREEAVVSYKKAIAHRRDFIQAYNDLGQVLFELGRWEEAIAPLSSAMAQAPQSATTARNLLQVLVTLQRYRDAVAVAETALKANPDNVRLRVSIAGLRRAICDFRGYDEDVVLMRAHPAEVDPFNFMAIPTSPAEQLACASAFATKIPGGKPFVHHKRESRGIIRIGYLSCDLHNHATAYLMAELFERHDRSRFHITAYAYDKDDGTAIRKRLEAAFDRFVPLAGVPASVIRQQIHDNGIDILVDLKGYTGNALLGVAAGRPAPIQVNYVGYPGTLGADWFDYIIADPIVAPFAHQPFFAEKIVHLPHCYQPNDRQRRISSETTSRAQRGLPDEAFVFANFNTSYKITPQVFGVWMRLLAAVPDSVLWLLASNDEMQQNLKAEAAARGIDPARVIFAVPLELERHLERMRHADLFLDTLPVGAHTSASDALWAGLPVLTVTGKSFISRVGTSLLHAVGLPELVTSSLEAYEARALALAQNREELATLRRRLAKARDTAALFDTARYTCALERAYAQMWERWQKGLPPEPFAVAEE